MQALAKTIHSTKTHYKHLLLLSALFFSLPGAAHATSLETRPQKLQHQTHGGLLPKRYILQNPLVALLTVSDYSKSEISSLPFVIKDEQILQKIFQNKYHYTTITPCKKLNYTVGKRKFIELLRNISDNLGQNLQHDGLIFVYNGHGESGTVRLSDGQSYPMAKICATFDNDTLDNWVGKPRIIIKLACRGGNTGQGILYPQPKTPTKEKIWHCQDQDFINIYANTDGNLVNECIDPNNKNKGSAFVEAFNELTNLNTTFQSNLDEILGMLGQQVSKIMQGTECIEWKKTFFGTLYLCKRTHDQHIKQQISSTKDLEERKSPDEPILQDLDDEKELDEPILEDTKQKEKTDKPSFDVEKLQHFIKTAIEEVEKSEKQLQTNEMAYFYGNTGAGKSTIINYLLGNELEKYYPEDEKNLHINKKPIDDQNNTNTQNQEDYTYASDSTDSDEEEKNFKIRLKDPNAIGPKIGQNDVQSETTYPCPYFQKNQTKPLGYCDTAGFSDVRGIENIVCSYIGNNLIIQKSEKIKAICFVTTKDALNVSRGQPFLNSVISTISNLIKETKDCNPLDSIFIVLNNKSKEKNKKLAKNVFKMLNNFMQGFRERKQNDQQNAPKYENYIKILKKILKDSTATKTIRILAINPLDQGESRKAFLDRISTSPIIPKKNLKKLASKQGEEKVKYLQEKVVQQTEPILDRILAEKKNIQEKEPKISRLSLQIEKIKKELQTLNTTINDFQNQSRDIEKQQQELKEKITNTKKEQQEIKNKIDKLKPNTTSSDYSKETEKLLSQYDHMINNQKEKIADLKYKQKNIQSEIQRYQHKIEDKNEQIDELALQLKKEQQQIDQLNKEKKHLLDNTTQKQIIALAKKQKNWFDHYQQWLTPISHHWAKTMLETNIFQEPKKQIYTQLQACNSNCRTLQGHTSCVNLVAFNPQGDLLASASRDHTIKLWNTTNWQCTKTLQAHTSSVWSVAFNPKGTFLASVDGHHGAFLLKRGTIKLWNTTNGQCIKTLQGHKHSVYSVAFNPQGHLLASGGGNIFFKPGTIKLWNTTNGQCIKTLQGHKHSVCSVAFHPKGTLLASASSDYTIKLWNTTNGQCTKTLQGHTGSVFSVAFNPQGDLLASASWDNTIKLWNTTNWQCTKTLQAHTSSVRSVAFNPKGDLLASASSDYTIKFWNTTSWQCTKTLQAHTSWVYSVAFNPQGTLLASASRDHTIKLWDSQHMLDSTKSNYAMLDRDQFKLKTDPHLKKITEILNHYYKDTVQALQNSEAQKKTKTFQTHITNLQKKMDEQKQEKTNLQKEIDSLNSTIDDLENKKLQQIETQIKDKKTKDQLAQLTQEKENIDTMLHNLQQDRTKKTEIFNKLDRQRFQAETKHEYLIKEFKKEKQSHENLSNELNRHEEELNNYEGMLERKQPSIDLILKIDKIVPMGLITLGFIKKYMQCKTNNKHM